MEKTIQLAMPNQPFVQDTSDGKTVNITYTGPRYLVVSHSKANNVVQAVEGRFQSLGDFELSEFVDDNDNFHILDADTHTALAAYLTEDYKNSEVDDFEETLPTGEVYNYPYVEEGIIDVIWDDVDFVYNEATGDYSGLAYRTTITQEQWDQSLVMQNEWIASIDVDSLDEEHAAAFATYSDWYANVATTYAGVDYWKIPTPIRPVV